LIILKSAETFIIYFNEASKRLQQPLFPSTLEKTKDYLNTRKQKDYSNSRKNERLFKY